MIINYSPRPRPFFRRVTTKGEPRQCASAHSGLLHNHPSGDPKPSRDDIQMTREVKAEALGIAIHDHLVIGRKGHASFRSLGLLS